MEEIRISVQCELKELLKEVAKKKNLSLDYYLRKELWKLVKK